MMFSFNKTHQVSEMDSQEENSEVAVDVRHFFLAIFSYFFTSGAIGGSCTKRSLPVDGFTDSATGQQNPNTHARDGLNIFVHFSALSLSVMQFLYLLLIIAYYI